MNTEQEKQLQQLETTIKPLMTKEAGERYSNVKVAHPEKAAKILILMSQLISAGKITEINDAIMRHVLVQLEPARRETKIKR